MTDDQIINNCLKKLFQAVKLTYPCPEFTDQPNWYTRCTWTTRQEARFRTWMTKYLRQHMRTRTAHSCEMEVAWFLLNYGWTTKDE